MKKFASILIITVLCCVLFGVVSSASVRLGDAIYTDIVTYINHVPIESYNFNGRTLIAAEDLKNFGFDVKWNEYKRTLTITRNKSRNDITESVVYCPDESEIGTKAFTVTTTDVRVFSGRYEFSAYGGIDGYTLIDINDLNCMDKVSVVWVPETRALKIWVEDGLEISQTMLRPVPGFSYYEYEWQAPGYSYYWSWDDEDYGFKMDFCMISDDGYYVNSDTGVVTITDVIDADGNSVLKKPVDSILTGTSSLPYVYGLSDEWLALCVILFPEDLYPRTAYENGGIIKFTYKEYGYSETMSDSIRVDTLPYIY